MTVFVRFLEKETLITFLTIENNNMNNYIVTFEYRVMVTAFAILAMFYKFYLKYTWCWQTLHVKRVKIVSGCCVGVLKSSYIYTCQISYHAFLCTSTTLFVFCLLRYISCPISSPEQPFKIHNLTDMLSHSSSYQPFLGLSKK